MTDTLSIGNLRPNPENPRVETGDVEELVESIRQFGILEPLVVSPDAKGYVVVCGHRRVKAAKLAGLKAVPVVVRPTDPEERELIALTENVHRKNLSPIEEALAYARLMKTRGLTQRAVAQLVQKHEVTVSQRLALLRLPEHMVQAVHSGEMAVVTALGIEKDFRRGRKAQPAKFNAGRKSKCTLEGHAACDGRKCEVRKCEVRKLQGKRKVAAA